MIRDCSFLSTVNDNDRSAYVDEWENIAPQKLRVLKDRIKDKFHQVSHNFIHGVALVPYRLIAIDLAGSLSVFKPTLKIFIYRVGQIKRRHFTFLLVAN